MEQVLALLQRSQDADKASRESAEDQLRQMAGSKGFAHLLSVICQEQSIPVAVRQSSGLLLKQVIVKEHWEATEEHPGVYALEDDEKEGIRRTLTACLGEPVKRLRRIICVVVAQIAAKDFPEQWPSYFDMMLENTRNANHDVIRGAMKCIEYFMEDVDGDAISSLAPTLIPELFSVVSNSSLDLDIRVSAMAVMFETVNVLGMVKDYENARTTSIIASSLKSWLPGLAGILQQVPMTKLHHGMQINAIKIINVLVQFFPKLMEPHIATIVGVLMHLTKTMYSRYVTTVVTAPGGEGGDSDDDGDSDTREAGGFKGELMQIFDLIRMLVNSPKKTIKSSIQPYLNQTCFMIVGYMQMTGEQVEQWNHSPAEYCQEEDDDSMDMSVRNSGRDLLEEVARSYKKGGSAAVYAGASMALEESNKVRPDEGWRLKEAALLALGQISSSMVQLYQSHRDPSTPPPFDLMAFLSMLHGILSSPTDIVYLKNRALWCASKFITEPDVPFKAAVPFISVSLAALEEGNVLPIKLTACRAIYRLMDPERIPLEKSAPFAPACIGAICKLLPGSTEESMHIVLDALKQCLGSDKGVVAATEPVITPMMLLLWQKHVNDPMILDDVLWIFTLLASTPLTHASLLSGLIPPIAGVLSNAHAHASGVIETMISLLNVLVENASAPFPPQLYGDLFSVLLQVIASTDDHSIMQTGASVLRNYVRRSPDQLKVWSNSNGNGIGQILNIVASFLGPNLTDSAVLYVGPLVTSIVQKFDSILDSHILGNMLEAVLRRMKIAKLPCLQNELLFVYARLYNSHGHGVLELAERITFEDGVNGLNFLLQSWVEWHCNFVHAYSRKVSIVALVKILLSRNKRIETILVKGDAIEDSSKSQEGIRTRSKEKANPTRYTSIPLPVKIFSLIVQEMYRLSEERKRGVDTGADEGLWNEDEEDTEDATGDHEEDDADDGAGGDFPARTGPSPFADADEYIHYLTGGTGDFDDVGEDLDVDDAREDPLYEEDAEKYLGEAVKGLMASEPAALSHLVSLLSPKDQGTFRDIFSS